MKKLRRGIAIPIVLLVLSLFIVVVTAVFEAGFNTQYQTNNSYESTQSLYAAEAGIAQSVRQIIAGTSGWNGYRNVSYGVNSQYSVEVIPGPATPAGGPQVPAGATYLLATGTTRSKFARQVGVLIRAGVGQATSDFPFALAAGAKIDMHGGGSINGSVKSSTDIDLGGGIRVRPFGGSGQILAGTNIQLGGGVKRDDSQDMRAVGTISRSSHTLPTDPSSLIFPNDTTPASMPFINDGRFTNTLTGTEKAKVLPNPDPERLLGLQPDGAGGYVFDALTGTYTLNPARTDVVQHTELTISGNLDLAGKIHFFPNGVDIQGTLSGKGSVVSGSGNSVRVSGRIGNPAEVNLLALSWPTGPKKGDIIVSDHLNMKGMLYAHGGIQLDKNVDLKGMMIAYSGGILNSGGHRAIEYDASGFGLPGFETWLGVPPASTGPGTATGITPGQPIIVLSWQRL